MKKEVGEKDRNSNDNSFGILGVTLGILSIIFSSPPINGLVLGILGLVMGIKQDKNNKMGWGKVAKILSVIGIILSIIMWIVLTYTLRTHPELLTQFGGGLGQ